MHGYQSTASALLPLWRGGELPNGDLRARAPPRTALATTFDTRRHAFVLRRTTTIRGSSTRRYEDGCPGSTGPVSSPHLRWKAISPAPPARSEATARSMPRLLGTLTLSDTVPDPEGTRVPRCGRSRRRACRALRVAESRCRARPLPTSTIRGGQALSRSAARRCFTEGLKWLIVFAWVPSRPKAPPPRRSLPEDYSRWSRSLPRVSPMPMSGGRAQDVFVSFYASPSEAHYAAPWLYAAAGTPAQRPALARATRKARHGRGAAPRHPGTGPGAGRRDGRDQVRGPRGAWAPSGSQRGASGASLQRAQLRGDRRRARAPAIEYWNAAPPS